MINFFFRTQTRTVFVNNTDASPNKSRSFPGFKTATSDRQTAQASSSCHDLHSADVGGDLPDPTWVMVGADEKDCGAQGETQPQPEPAVFTGEKFRSAPVSNSRSENASQKDAEHLPGPAPSHVTRDDRVPDVGDQSCGSAGAFFVDNANERVSLGNVDEAVTDGATESRAAQLGGEDIGGQTVATSAPESDAGKHPWLVAFEITAAFFNLFCCKVPSLPSVFFPKMDHSSHACNSDTNILAYVAWV